MKNGKEVKINDFNNYNVVIGSVNNKHSKAIYINISAWANPQDEDELNYTKVIKDLNKKIKQSLFHLFNIEDNIVFNKDMTIVDLDIRESGIRYGKRSFMSCETTLFLNSEIPVNSDKIKPILDTILKLIIISTFDENKSFKFHKKKN